jgi:serine/threonine protein kinase
MLESVGVGYLAQVFEAKRVEAVSEDVTTENTECSGPLVVKVCNVTEEVHEAAVENERRILRKLPASPHIVALLDDYNDPLTNKAYLVLERAGDTSLESFIKKRGQNLALDEVRKITRQMCEAVKFLHAHQVVHRDLKPDNIMLTEPELALKLIDFNVAHDLAENPEIRGATGVRAWSAPETRKFQSYDERCDVWSVGCILYYLCTGKAPFSDDCDELTDD